MVNPLFEDRERRIKGKNLNSPLSSYDFPFSVKPKSKSKKLSPHQYFLVRIFALLSKFALSIPLFIFLTYDYDWAFWIYLVIYFIILAVVSKIFAENFEE